MLILRQDVADIVLSRNPVYFKLENTDTALVFYKVLYEVFFEDVYLSDTFRKIASLEAYTDTHNFIHLDIQDILDAAVKQSFSAQPIPRFDTNTLTKSDTLRRYKIQFAEKYGSPSTTTAFNELPIKYVQFGGIAQNLWQDNPTFLASTSNQNRILSWYPRTKVVSLEQVEFLPFRALADYEAIALSITLTAQDGTTSVVEKFAIGAPFFLRKGEIVLVPTGPLQLGLPNADTLIRYQVRLRQYNSATTFLSEPYTYYIDTAFNESTRYIMYLNGFGQPQTLRCTGRFSYSLNIQRTESTSPQTPGRDLAQSGDVALRPVQDNSMTYRTGDLRNDEIHALQELLTAEYVYEVFEEGFIPLRLTDKQFRITETGNFTSVLEFNAVPRLDYRNYSNASTFNITPSLSAWKDDDADQKNRLALALKWR